MTTASEHPPQPGHISTPGADEFIAAQESPEFQRLRKTLRNFVFPMTAFFLTWYGLYLVLGVFAPGFMGTPVWGNINVGLILGLLQFVTTFAITGAYIWFANHRLDPEAEVVREGFDDGTYAREADAAVGGVR
ncbi:DUF485 domain-containing protein [Gordonia iterans]|uniref:DUF485 domain-containing protein n=1 Tax=Gordonia iterans TaxID=1004901 RepID=UPI0018FE43B0|nr:DUF485 domain-containing protein [Gordonia iterans]